MYSIHYQINDSFTHLLIYLSTSNCEYCTTKHNMSALRGRNTVQVPQYTRVRCILSERMKSIGWPARLLSAQRNGLENSRSELESTVLVNSLNLYYYFTVLYTILYSTVHTYSTCTVLVPIRPRAHLERVLEIVERVLGAHGVVRTPVKVHLWFRIKILVLYFHNH